MDNPAVRRLVGQLRLAPYLRTLRHIYKPKWVRVQRVEHEQIRLVLACVLSSASCCVDVGANAGDFLRDVLRCARERGHIAFEPLLPLANQIRSDHLDFEVHEVALSDSEGEALFNHVQTASVYSCLHARRLPNGGGCRQAHRPNGPDQRRPSTRVRPDVYDLFGQSPSTGERFSALAQERGASNFIARS